jgi:hypothetical protein
MLLGCDAVFGEFSAGDPQYCSNAGACVAPLQCDLTVNRCVAPTTPTPPTLPAPLLASVSPARASTAGGTILQVSGSNFVRGATVSVDGQPAVTIFVSATELSATLSMRLGALGPVPVQVKNPDGQTAAASNLFSYYASTVSFADNYFTVGALPYALAIADFNGDKLLDLAASDIQGSAVDVFLHDSLGGFGSLMSFPASSNPYILTTGDWNSDGNIDLATANVIPTGNTVGILFGDGTGMFSMPHTYTVGQEPDGLAAADFNNDGNLDLAVTNYDAGTISLLLGDGAGNFPAAMSSTIPGFDGPCAPVAADFNGDGNIDLAIVNQDSNNVNILLGNGNGTFQSFSNTSVGQQPQRMQLGDFDGDGNIDLVTVDANSYQVTALLGDGTGGIKQQASFPACVPQPSALAVAVADINGDNNQDLVVGCVAYSQFAVLLGDGKGGFAPQALFPAGASAPAIAAADLTGDGRPEVVLTDQDNGRVHVLLNTSQ